ncbi:MAG: undecaprenyldiphospho-muramoylpentapeptide beta-N-acetylglucosaminyltransferase [Bacteroidetes bacterium]|nr:undecaprenyldiphospho-muramoylpentapeptide beta-N-acetylglucosaminyltransferase [Bacteroidota bacterium]
MSGKRFIISGGGTGGHIFPAIAIANMLKKQLPDCEILFVGADDRMEMQRVPEAGYKIKGLTIAGFQRGQILSNLGLPFKVIGSLSAARSIVKEFKPSAAIGVGGYASGPLLMAASLSGVPCIIQEQNSFAGITNKILARRAKKICVAYDGMETVFPAEKIVLTGNPIRAEIIHDDISHKDAYSYFDLDENKKTILIIGGSLGARTINESIYAFADKIKGTGTQLLWQTGKVWAKENPDTENIHQTQFIVRMDYAYAAADIIISRAGALSIAELQNIGKPVVLVPSPNVTEDHQTHNAMALVNKNAAILVRDSEAKVKLMTTAMQLLRDEAKKTELSNNIKKMAITDAAERIVREILEVAKD